MAKWVRCFCGAVANYRIYYVWVVSKTNAEGLCVWSEPQSNWLLQWENLSVCSDVFVLWRNVCCLVEMWHANVRFYTLVLYCFSSSHFWTQVSNEILTPGFAMNLLVTISFYCLFQLTQHDCITLVWYITGINNTNGPLTYCLHESNKALGAVYLRNCLHFIRYYKNCVHDVTNHFTSVWSIMQNVSPA